MRRRSCIFIILFTAILVLSVNFFSPHGALLAASKSMTPPQGSPIVNLALNKLASQSSTDTVNSADRAVDGNTNGNISAGSVAQTLTELRPWWEVDLGEIGYIDNVQAYTRTDCCSNEFKSAYLFVSEVPFVSQDLNATLNQPEVSSYFFNLIPGTLGPSTLDLQRTARYVRIQSADSSLKNLHLAEVQVMGIQVSNNPGVSGQWTSVPDLHNEAGPMSTLSLVHLSLLPNKKLLFWGRDKGPDRGPNSIDDVDDVSDAYVWDLSKEDNLNTPQDERLTLVRNNRTNLFCAGHSFLPNGNLFVAGGDKNPVDNLGAVRYELDGHGVKQTNIFDYATETWIAGPDMRQPRWYPSLVTLSNGETLIVTGSFVTFTPSNAFEFHQNQDTEIFGLDGTIRRLSADLPVSLPNYPFAHLGPDGNARVISGTSRQGLFYKASDGTWPAQTNLDLVEVHDQGTSVYDGGKIMAIGGRQGGTNVTRHTETIDLNSPGSGWTPGTSMHFERYYGTSVLMPDGEVFVVGGSKCGGANNIQSSDGLCRSGAVMYPEIYEPVSQTWSIMSRQQILRMYHSVALLLPDARIMVAGGGRPGAFGENGVPAADKYLAHREVEIFSPPYLFNSNGMPATRPTITNEPPQTLTYGQSLNLQIGNVAATQIQDVVLVRLPSVTHALNFDQRRVVLTRQPLDQQTLSVTAPSNGTECPPGPYMLFVLGPNHVPSLAKMILLANGACASPAPTGLAATALSNTQVSIVWGAPNATVHHYEVDRKQSFSAQFVKIADVAGSITNYTDLSVTGSVGYLYQVRAVCSSGGSSPPSNMDLATTMSFTDDPLTVGVTVVKAQHINELRTAVNAVRDTASLAQAGWTDPSLQVAFVRAVHITELRQNLNQGLQAMGFMVPSYTDGTLSSGVTVVKKVHVEELRQALR